MNELGAPTPQEHHDGNPLYKRVHPDAVEDYDKAETLARVENSPILDAARLAKEAGQDGIANLLFEQNRQRVEEAKSDYEKREEYSKSAEQVAAKILEEIVANPDKDIDLHWIGKGPKYRSFFEEQFGDYLPPQLMQDYERYKSESMSRDEMSRTELLANNEFHSRLLEEMRMIQAMIRTKVIEILFDKETQEQLRVFGGNILTKGYEVTKSPRDEFDLDSDSDYQKIQNNLYLEPIQVTDRRGVTFKVPQKFGGGGVVDSPVLNIDDISGYPLRLVRS